MNVIDTGGDFKVPKLALMSQKATIYFQNLYLDKLFIATDDIALKSGLSFPGISDIYVKHTMIEFAYEIYLVADSS